MCWRHPGQRISHSSRAWETLQNSSLPPTKTTLQAWGGRFVKRSWNWFTHQQLKLMTPVNRRWRRAQKKVLEDSGSFRESCITRTGMSSRADPSTPGFRWRPCGGCGPSNKRSSQISEKVVQLVWVWTVIELLNDAVEMKKRGEVTFKLLLFVDEVCYSAANCMERETA